MCCRFAINESVIGWLRKYQQDVQTIKLGDIHPTENAPVLVAGKEEPALSYMSWGMTQPGKQLVINARCETAWEKPLFREAMHKHRCVLPAAWFYEWDLQKRKNIFHAAKGVILFLAGVYDENDRFVVLTTAADDVMRPVHDRMPVCIYEGVVREWIFDDNKARDILRQQGVALRRSKSREQCSLLD